MDGIEVADLHEPGADAFHHLPACLQALAPVRLPLEEVSREERVGAQLEEPAELARGGRGPEREFLHKRRIFRDDELLEFLVECREVGVPGDVVERGMVAVVPLIFPDVDC
jgi:hypothetical protein